MKISKTHQCFADRPVFQRALDHPEEFLGPNWKDVLNFWLYLDSLSLYLDSLSDEQLEIYSQYYDELRVSDDYFRLTDLARNASGATIGEGVSNLAWHNTSTTVGFSSTTVGFAAGYATLELIGSHKIIEQGESLAFVPLFLNL